MSLGRLGDGSNRRKAAALHMGSSWGVRPEFGAIAIPQAARSYVVEDTEPRILYHVASNGHLACIVTAFEQRLTPDVHLHARLARHERDAVTVHAFEAPLSRFRALA